MSNHTKGVLFAISMTAGIIFVLANFIGFIATMDQMDHYRDKKDTICNQKIKYIIPAINIACWASERIEE